MVEDTDIWEGWMEDEGEVCRKGVYFQDGITGIHDLLDYLD